MPAAQLLNPTCSNVKAFFKTTKKSLLEKFGSLHILSRTVPIQKVSTRGTCSIGESTVGDARSNSVDLFIFFFTLFITLFPFYSGSGQSSRPFRAVHTGTVPSPFLRPIHGANLLEYNEIYSSYIHHNIYSLNLCPISHEPLDDGHTCSIIYLKNLPA